MLLDNPRPRNGSFMLRRHPPRATQPRPTTHRDRGTAASCLDVILREQRSLGPQCIEIEDQTFTPRHCDFAFEGAGRLRVPAIRAALEDLERVRAWIDDPVEANA